MTSLTLVSLLESPSSVLIQKIGDSAGNITASEGEEIELECVVSGGNPPAKIKWFSHNREIISGHRQEDERLTSNETRIWRSVSRLTFPVKRSDDNSAIRCEALHPTLAEPMSSTAALSVHCKSSNQNNYLNEQQLGISLTVLQTLQRSELKPRLWIIWRPAKTL